MRFTWCDLPAYHPDKARAFYGQLLGWDIPKEGYAFASSEGQPVAGLYDMPTHMRDLRMPSFWTSYIQVPRLGDTVAQAMTEGGQLERIAPFNDGRMALLRDPMGAGFTVYEASLSPGLTGDRPGARAWSALMAPADPELVRFYERLLGWTTAQDGPALRFDDAEGPVAHLLEIPPTVRSAAVGWTLAFAVADLDSATETLRAAGGEVLGETQHPRGRALWVADMDGAAFHLTAAAKAG